MFREGTELAALTADWRRNMKGSVRSDNKNVLTEFLVDAILKPTGDWILDQLQEVLRIRREVRQSLRWIDRSGLN